MKTKSIQTLNLAVLAVMSFMLVTAMHGQSPDMDNPTAITSNVIQGEGDGKAETVYYTFGALKGDVKITVDAKTDDRSTPLRVFLLDEDGQELLPIYVIANGSGTRQTGSKRFVRDTKVILKIRVDADKDINLLTYKIKLDGSVKIDQPVVSSGPPPATEVTTGGPPLEQVPNPSPVPADGTTQKKLKLADKLKEKLKKEVKKTAAGILDN